MTPGLTDESVHVVIVNVDLNNFNINLKQYLDEGEHVQFRGFHFLEG